MASWSKCFEQTRRYIGEEDRATLEKLFGERGAELDDPNALRGAVQPTLRDLLAARSKIIGQLGPLTPAEVLSQPSSETVAPDFDPNVYADEMVTSGAIPEGATPGEIDAALPALEARLSDVQTRLDEAKEAAKAAEGEADTSKIEQLTAELDEIKKLKTEAEQARDAAVEASEAAKQALIDSQPTPELQKLVEHITGGGSLSRQEFPAIAKAAGVEPEALPALMEQAVARGVLRKNKRGQYRRAVPGSAQSQATPEQKVQTVRQTVQDVARAMAPMLPRGTTVRSFAELAELPANIRGGLEQRGTEVVDRATGSTVDAFVDPNDPRVIYLAQYAMNKQGRLGHEGVHILKALNLITDAEIATLADRARKTKAFDKATEAAYRKAYAGRPNLDALINEEAAAALIEARINGTSFGKKVDGILDRIIQFLDRLANALRQRGFQTADDVADAVLSGEVARREAIQQFMAENDFTAMAVKPAPAVEPAPQQTGPRMSRVTTPDGSASYDVEFEVVNLSDLKPATGDLQPRDRSSRAASAAQVQSMAGNLNPDLLIYSAQSDRGAPIIDENGVVLSGNGRVSAIRAAREMGADGYQQYVARLNAEGFDTAGKDQPVLVRRIKGLDQAGKRDFAVKSNQDDKLAMSAGEQARVDRDLMTDDTLALLDPDGEGGLRSPGNRAFVRAVMGKMSAAQRGAFVGEGGELSPAGVARLEAAIFARAYDDRTLVNRIVEDQDGAGMRNALLGAAPAWAQMRAVAPEGFDVTKNLVEAVQTVIRLRERRIKPNEYFAQQDAFTQVSPTTETLIRAFYNQGGTRAASWQSTRDLLKSYARIAMDQSNAVGDLMGETLTPQAIMEGQLRSREGDGQGLMFAFAGERAKTADLDKLRRARDMEDAGSDRTAIWKETGWFRGVDGKWRFEVDDSSIRVQAGRGRSFARGPVVNPAIANNYDTLKVVTRVDDFSDPNYGEDGKRNTTLPPMIDGAFRTEPGTWFRGPQQVLEIQSLNQNLRPIGAHEGQHFIQRVESFARGGGPRQFTPEQIAYERARLRLSSEAEETGWSSVGTVAGDMSDLDVGRSLYRRLAGEVEARTVEKRLDLTPEQRAARPPWQDYDVPENEQIVRFGAGASSSIMYALDVQTGRDMRRTLDSLGFYSKLDEVLGGFGPKDKVTAATLAQRGVKAAEIEARGLQAMLADGKAAPVADLLRIAGENRVQLNEVGYAPQAVLFDELEKVFRGDGHSPEQANRFANMVLSGQVAAKDLSFNPQAAAIEAELKKGKGPSKWQTYSLDPSNPTYRETVIHLPAGERVPSKIEIKPEHGGFTYWVIGDGSSMSGWENTEEKAREKAQRDADRFMKEGRRSPDDFQSGHFPEPNIVGHMMTSLTRHQGKTVFTVDQIQSDWGQKLRDKGVRDEAKISDLNARLDAMEKALGPRMRSDERDFLQANNWDKSTALKEIDQRIKRHIGVGTPLETLREVAQSIEARDEKTLRDYGLTFAELRTAEAATTGNPLVNTTDRWVDLTLRRAITQAVEADADYIAIPSGDTVLGYNPGDTDGMRTFYGAVKTRDAADYADLQDAIQLAKAAVDDALKNQREVQRRNAERTTPNSAKELTTARSEVQAAEKKWSDLQKEAKAMEVFGETRITGIVPKNLGKLLGTKGEPIDTLDSPSGKTGLGKGFTLFPLTSETKSKVKDEGMPMFALLVQTSTRLYRGEPTNAQGGQGIHYTRSYDRAKGYAGPDGKVYFVDVPIERMGELGRGRGGDMNYTLPADLQAQRQEVTPADVLYAMRPGDNSIRRDNPMRSVQVIIQDLAQSLGLTIRQGMRTAEGRAARRQGAAGIYDPNTGIIRLRSIQELNIAIEAMGAALEHQYNAPNANAQLGTLINLNQNELPNGFAAFFNEYLIAPGAAQQNAPNFFDAFETFLDLNDPVLLAKLESAQEAIAAYFQQDPTQFVEAMIRDPREPNFWEQMRDDARRFGLFGALSMRMTSFYTAAFDSTNPFTVAVWEALNQYRRDTGQKIDLNQNENPAKIMRLAKHTPAHAMRAMEEGIRPRSSNRPRGPALIRALTEALGDNTTNARDTGPGSRYRQFGAYLIARYSALEWERFANGQKEAQPTRYPVGTATPQQAIQYYRGVASALEQRNASFVRAADMLYDYQRELLTLQRDAGLISTETYDILIQDREYVPMYRVFEDSEDLSSSRALGGGPGGILKRKRGSERDIVDPIASIAQKTFETYDLVARNDIKRSLMTLAERVGPAGGVIAERIEPNRLRQQSVDLDTAINNAAREAGVDPADRATLLDLMHQMLGNDAVSTYYTQQTITPGREPIVFFFENGEVQAMRLGNGGHGHQLAKQMFDALNTYGREHLDVAIQLAAIPAQMTRLGVVTHPEFMAANPVRDALMAFMYDPRAIPLWTQIKGTIDVLRNADYVRQYYAYGGMMGGEATSSLSKLRTERDIQALVDRGYRFRYFDSLTGAMRFLTDTVSGAAAGATMFAGTVVGGATGASVGGLPGLVAGSVAGGAAARVALGRVGLGRNALDSGVGGAIGAIAGGAIGGPVGAGIGFTAGTLIGGKALAAAGEVSETATRARLWRHAYYRARNNGLDEVSAAQEAAFWAHDYTDYSRRGSKMDALAAMIPFLNANLQGNDVYIRRLLGKTDQSYVSLSGPFAYPAYRLGLLDATNLSQQEQQALALSGWAWAMTILGLGSISALVSLMWEDDERIKNIDDRVKATHWLIPVGDTIVRVPKPFQTVWFSQLIERYVTQLRHNDPRWFENYVEDLWNTWKPPIIPSVAEGLATMTGYDLNTGRQILPFYMTMGGVRSRPEQFDAYTSDFAKWVGREIDTSPMYVDHLVHKFGASWGRTLTGLNVPGLPWYNPGKPTKGPEEEFIARRFLWKVGRGSEAGQAIREIMGAEEPIKSIWSFIAQPYSKLAVAGQDYRRFLEKVVPDHAGATEYLETLSPSERGYAILEANFRGQRDAKYRMLHPMNRAEKITGEIIKLQKEILTDQVASGRKGKDAKPIPLSPSEKAAARDILTQLQMMEAHNALVISGEIGWKQRILFDTNSVMAELREAVPSLAKEYEGRLGKAGVLPFEGIRRVWPELKATIESDRVVDLARKNQVGSLRGTIVSAYTRAQFGMPASSPQPAETDAQ